MSMDDIPMPEPPERLRRLLDEALGRASGMQLMQDRLARLEADVRKPANATGGMRMFVVVLNIYSYSGLDTAGVESALRALPGFNAFMQFSATAWFVQAADTQPADIRDCLAQCTKNKAEIIVSQLTPFYAATLLSMNSKAHEWLRMALLDLKKQRGS